MFWEGYSWKTYWGPHQYVYVCACICLDGMNLRAQHWHYIHILVHFALCQCTHTPQQTHHKTHTFSYHLRTVRGPTGPKVDRRWGILFFKDNLMVEQRLWKQWHMLDCLKMSIRQNMPSSSDSMSLQQKVKNGIKSPKWLVSMFVIHLQKLLWMLLPWTHQSQGKGSCIYNYMYRLASKASITSCLHLRK